MRHGSSDSVAGRPSVAVGDQAHLDERTPMTRRRTCLLAAALLLVSACSASGSDSEGGSGGGGGGGGGSTTTEADAPDGDPDQIVADAADATLAASSFTVESEANLTVGPQRFRLATEGSLDYENLVADATIGIEQAGSATEVSLLADGETLWVKADEIEGVTLPDPEKVWIEGEATLLDESGSFRPVDLIGVILALRGADGAEAGESEEIDGVSTTKYTFSLDYDEAVEAAGEDEEAFTSALSLRSEDPIELTIDAWIGDDDGILRRFALETDAGSAPLGADYAIELADVGDDVEAPDAPESATILRGEQAADLLEQIFSS